MLIANSFSFFPFSNSALLEVVSNSLPYNMVYEMRDQLWEIFPTLVRHDVTEPTSIEITLAGFTCCSNHWCESHEYTPVETDIQLLSNRSYLKSVSFTNFQALFV